MPYLPETEEQFEQIQRLSDNHVDFIDWKRICYDLQLDC